MSTSLPRLRRILTTKKPKPTEPKPEPTEPTKPKPISIKELANEPDPFILATKFKKRAQESLSFRDRHNIYNYTISRLALSNHFSLIQDILESHKDFPEITHEGFSTRLIVLYGKAGMFDHARKVFDEMPQRNCPRTVMSLNALMKAGLDSNRFDDVVGIFKGLSLELSIGLNCVSYNIGVHCYTKMGLIDDALLLLREMKANGVTPNVITFNTLLDGFYQRGFQHGEKVWDMMSEYAVEPDTNSYNLKMKALMNVGEVGAAIQVYERLEEQGLKRGVQTYNVFIKGYIDQDNYDEAKGWYNSLVGSGEKPNSITFTILASRLCDGGDHEMAYDLCKSMFNRHFVVEEGLMQLVVNSLVKGSMVEQAKELVELGKSNKFVKYNLVLPIDS